MPRNGSGTMSPSATHVSGTTITASALNGINTDISTEITNSLPRDGQSAMTGQMKAADGTAALPGVTFGSDPDTGLYRASANTMGIAAAGAQVGAVSSSGLAMTGSARLSDADGTFRYYATLNPTGMLAPYIGTSAPTGWVLASGKTIGNASSGGTERANADTETLFTLLWNTFADAQAAVSSGRGASAAADYATNKTIVVPDLRGRTIFGLDNIGGSAASRLGTVMTSQTTPGTSGGAETVTLDLTMVPAHDHGGVSGAGGDHTHFAIANAAGSPSLDATNQLGSSRDFGSVFSYVLAGTTTAATIGKTSASGTHTHSVTSAGGGAAHSNMPPAMLMTWIIKL